MAQIHDDALPDVPKSLVYRILSLPGKALLEGFGWLISKSGPDPVFYNVADFPWVPAVEARYPDIRRELDVLLLAPEQVPDITVVFPEQVQIARKSAWKSYFFRIYSHDIEKNLAQCPATAQALKEIPQLRTAFFSILAPGGAITPHRGPYKGVLRYHLGLMTPTPPELCGIAFGEEQRCWHEGKSLIFDDTHEHRAWNNSQQVRVVLFVDFDRPMSLPLRLVHHTLYGLLRRSPFITRVVHNLKQENQ